jgi:hypothetical protein
LPVAGTDVMIFKFFRKMWRKNRRFLIQIKGNFAEKVIITLVLEKTPIFSPKIGKNRRKL